MSRFALCAALVLVAAPGFAQEPQEPYGDDDQQQQQQQYQQQQYQQQQYQQQQYQQQQYQQQQYQQQQYQQQDPNQYPPADPNYPPPDPNAAPQVTQYGYVGAHPIPYDAGGGYCYQTAAHYHEYPPFDQYLFRESNGFFYFIGDPSDFGYTQQLWGYSGNHPIPLNWGGGYCYINWPHRHPYPPPSTVYYNFVDGYYAYAGPWDPLYWQWRDRYWGYYGGYYRTNYYGGRYWVVRPPPVYRPALVVGAPGVYRGSWAVGAGGVRVFAPGPRVGVTVTAPGVRVGAPPAHYVGAPPANYGGRYVGAPPANYGGHYVGAPPAHYSAPPAPTYRRYSAPPPARYSAPAHYSSPGFRRR